MLVLTRQRGERIVIDSNIEVTVLQVSGNRVRLGIRAPSDVTILRSELAVQPLDEGRPLSSDAAPATAGCVIG